MVMSVKVISHRIDSSIPISVYLIVRRKKNLFFPKADARDYGNSSWEVNTHRTVHTNPFIMQITQMILLFFMLARVQAFGSTYQPVCCGHHDQLSYFWKWNFILSQKLMVLCKKHREREKRRRRKRKICATVNKVFVSSVSCSEKTNIQLHTLANSYIRECRLESTKCISCNKIAQLPPINLVLSSDS